VPIAVYGPFAAVTGLQPPCGAPFPFLTVVLVPKTGNALAFALNFPAARGASGVQWRLYAVRWSLIFAIGGTALAVGPVY
jgi:hypothetical protein